MPLEGTVVVLKKSNGNIVEQLLPIKPGVLSFVFKGGYFHTVCHAYRVCRLYQRTDFYND